MPKNKSLVELPDLGPKSQQWLRAVGVRTHVDIERLGVVTIYQLLRQQQYPVTLNMAYALDAALKGTDWRALPVKRKQELKRAIRTAAKPRCRWAGTDPLYMRYHDEEWGVPVHDDRLLFEFLILEGAQAGLSWITILRKREAYRAAFANFEPARVARFDAKKRRQLMKNPGIVRNRLKIESTVTNAQAFLAVQREFGSFDKYVWRFVGGRPRINHRRSFAEVPARTAESDALSRDLLQRGFRFVGSTICYAFMQAVGMVNDHSADCFRAPRRQRAKQSLSRGVERRR